MPSVAPPHHIILIGLMGCGKTTVGRWLSQETGAPFLDMDALIEEQIGKSIPEIFAENGEAHFRSLETAFLHYLEQETASPPEGYIISTGGGVVMREENREILRRLGFCVWLNVGVDALIQRTARGQGRPLLNTDNPREVLEKLMALRRPMYEATAHYQLDATQLDVLQVTRMVREASHQYFA